LSVIETRIVHSLSDAYAHYREQLALGREGTIIKDANAIWRDGTSKQQVKLKLEVDVDLEVVGFRAGEGKNAATFGSVLCRTACGQLEVAVSGFRDKVRKEIHESREKVLGSIMTVRANSIMVPQEDGALHSLFLPRFVELRIDKREADTLLESSAAVRVCSRT
jgi:DNA ligase-1